MSEFSEVKSTLDDIARQIVTARSEAVSAVEILNNAKSRLASLANTHKDVITTITGYAGSGNAAEANANAEFQKLLAEFQALSGKIDTAIAAL